MATNAIKLVDDDHLALGVLVTGTEGADTLSDTLDGHPDASTNDTIIGLGGSDQIFIHNGNDTVYAGEGNDFIHDWGIGDDTMYGQGGRDTFEVDQGNNFIDGGTDIDTVNYQSSRYQVGIDLESGNAYSDGHDTLVSIENAVGTRFGDAILGSGVANNLMGYDGDDFIDGRGGDDTINGQTGNDTLYGRAGIDTLIGEYGDDIMDGGADADILIGGRGNDTMTGGAGADTFVYTAPSDIYAFDTITDFQHGVDKIDLRALDANSKAAGNQAFNFDGSPDGSWEEFWDGASDDWDGLVSNEPGPYINGDTAEVEFRYDGGYTYIYLATGDGLIDASIRLVGTVTLDANDFLL